MIYLSIVEILFQLALYFLFRKFSYSCLNASKAFSSGRFEKLHKLGYYKPLQTIKDIDVFMIYDALRNIFPKAGKNR